MGTAIVKDLHTQRMKLSELGEYKSTLNWVSKEHDIPEDDVEFVRKGHIETKAEVDENERTIVRLVSTPHVDRDGEIVMPKGIDLKDFNRNPVVLFGHNYNSLPIGKDLWIKATPQGLKAKTQFATPEANPMAEQVFQLNKEGILNTSSIGFVPVEWVDEGEDGFKELLKEVQGASGLSKAQTKGCRRIFKRVILLEHSDVPVPANPNAVNLAMEKNIQIGEEVKSAIEQFIEIEPDPTEEVIQITKGQWDELTKRLDEQDEIIEALTTVELVEDEIKIDLTPDKVELDFEPSNKEIDYKEFMKDVGPMLKDAFADLSIKGVGTEELKLQLARRKGQPIE